MNRTRRSCLALLAVPLLLASLPSTAFAGPPWISIETPVNPYDPTTRGAFLMVHAYHHGTPVSIPVTGVAEGIVNGERRTVTLRFTKTSNPGVYALANQWGAEGDWSLVITVAENPDNMAQALVQVLDGRILSVAVPTTRGRDGMTIPRRLTKAEILASLRDRSTRVATYKP